MRRTFLAALFALLVIPELYAQKKLVSIPVNQSGDTTLWYHWQRERMATMGMIDPRVSTDSLMMRLSSENWSVEIWTNDFKTFKAKQYFFTKQVFANTDQSLRRSEKLLFDTKPLKKSQARKIFEAFAKRSIASIPHEDELKPRMITADGTSYLIEYATPTTFTFKTYSNPSTARSHIKEMIAIDDFIREIEMSLESASSFVAFLDSLPPGTYHTGGITVHTSTGKKYKGRKRSM